jgi:hypothetical protein
MRWSRLYTCMASIVFYELTCISFLKYRFVDSDRYWSYSVVLDITEIWTPFLVSDIVSFCFSQRNVNGKWRSLLRIVRNCGSPIVRLALTGNSMKLDSSIIHQMPKEIGGASARTSRQTSPCDARTTCPRSLIFPPHVHPISSQRPRVWRTRLAFAPPRTRAPTDGPERVARHVR